MVLSLPGLPQPLPLAPHQGRLLQLLLVCLMVVLMRLALLPSDL
jgi:hypothetical protein